MSDYKISDTSLQNSVDSAYYISNSAINIEKRKLIDEKIITQNEANLVFSDGYAGKRNIILYLAIKSKMDYLIFLDDDEYPVAAVNSNNNLMWMGQDVLATHLRYIPNCDITHGYHCGYVSPIPSFTFNDTLTENDFRIFIDAISNDIITWDSIKKNMDNGGIKYADNAVLECSDSQVVEEINGMKFISGANLGLNLEKHQHIYAFYNPPHARGEDAFLSTCLSNCNIQKVPCYTFHDGFAMYSSLLYGDLPKKLKSITTESNVIKKRFYNAAIGWIRYKPLILYIANKKNFIKETNKMKRDLNLVLPKLCEYFEDDIFKNIFKDLNYYIDRVPEHDKEFKKTKLAWIKIMESL